VKLKTSVSFDKKIDLFDFENKRLDLIKFKTDFFSIFSLADIEQVIVDDKESKVEMEDGYFWPLPYSTIHTNSFEEGLLTSKYFKCASKANNVECKSLGKTYSNVFSDLLHSLFKQEVLPLVYEGGEFANFGIRNLLSKKNGIDIHCENAFLYQLEPRFRMWLQENVDIENSISFFIVLQKPESGGDLILFDECWDNFQLKLGETTYAERHDLEGSLFTNKQRVKPERMNLSFDEGEGVVFRAAQIWHAIDKIEGNSNRITIGCFIAKGNDGKYYFWA
jgi:hypothetical protein